MILRHRMITIDCIVIISSLVCNIPSILLENSTLIGKVPWPCILAFVVYMVFRICKLDSIYRTNKEIFSHCQSLRKYSYLDHFQILILEQFIFNDDLYIPYSHRMLSIKYNVLNKNIICCQYKTALVFNDSCITMESHVFLVISQNWL